jgi:hypothetical protein
VDGWVDLPEVGESDEGENGSVDGDDGRYVSLCSQTDMTSECVDELEIEREVVQT